MKIIEHKIEKYKVLISNDFVNDKLEEYLENKTYFICIDSRVMHFYGDYLKDVINNAKDKIVIEAVEKNKTQESINSIIDMLYENNADRNSYIIAIGGGLIGDLTGFAAATYMRGINLIHVPTSMLAMSDSAIGNKVAINYNNTKNLIGTFYPPTLVIIDIIFLNNLTTRLFKEGLVELIKNGYIGNYSIIETLNTYENVQQIRDDKKQLVKLISKSLKVKETIVKKDPYEQDIRKHLNFGHTVAHCLELNNDNDYFHGECVAIGMLLAASLNEGKFKNKVFLDIKQILEKFECIRELKPINFELMNHDKKKNDDFISEVILPAVEVPIINKYKIDNLINIYKNNYLKLKTKVKQTKQQFIFNKVELKGKVSIPPSKSMIHRYLFASMLSKDITTLTNVTSLSDDIMVSIRLIQAFNVKVSYIKNSLVIDSTDLKYQDYVSVNMQESASSLRISLPIILGLANKITIKGQQSLAQRPLDPYFTIFKENDVNYEIKAINNFLPLEISGKLKNNVYKIPGNISSQFISGLLFALPLLPHDSSIILTSPLESLSYVKMSVQVLSEFGIKISHNDSYTLFKVDGNQQYVTRNIYGVEQDFSSRTFFEVANAIGNDVTFASPITKSNQDESRINSLLNTKTNYLDLTNMPDAAPAMAIYFSQNGGILHSISRLKFKESNRLKAIKDFLNVMNIETIEKDNNLIIEKGKINGGHFNTYKDHRITMSLIIASTISTSPVVIDEISSINKSFPTFIQEYEKLGGFVDEK